MLGIKPIFLLNVSDHTTTYFLGLSQTYKKHTLIRHFKDSTLAKYCKFLSFIYMYMSMERT